MTEHDWTRRDLLRNTAAVGAALALTGGRVSAAPKQPALTNAQIAGIEAALGKKGSFDADEGSLTIELPRHDLTPCVGGLQVPVDLGFAGEVGLQRTVDGRGAALGGELALLESEVPAAMDAVQAQGFKVSALHNHFLADDPRVMCLHFMGLGPDPVALARKLAEALRPMKSFPANQPTPPPPAEPPDRVFDVAALNAIVKHAGQPHGSAYVWELGRDGLDVRMGNLKLGKAMEVVTAAFLVGTNDDAHIAGDLALLEPEVDPVARALRRSGLQVAAIHQHHLGERPRLIYLHHYGHGRAADLVRGFRAVLDQLDQHGRGMAGM